jgi:hypothetical protein
MADVYIADSTFAKYVGKYGDDAKAEIRSIVKSNAPGGDGDE